MCRPPIFVTIVAPIKPLLSPTLLFVCLSLFLYQDHDGNWTPVQDRPLQVENCFGRRRS